MPAQSVKISIYDPTRGESLELHTAGKPDRFSSCEIGLYALEAIGQFDWGSKLELIQQLFSLTSCSGVYSVVPWYPGADKLEERLLKTPFGAHVDNGVIYGYFDDPKQITTVWSIREETGASNSGEWCIAGISEKFAKVFAKGSRFDLNYFLNHAQDLGFLLNLGEMHQSLLLFRPFPGVREFMEKLLESPTH
jgi:hypothetical protein